MPGSQKGGMTAYSPIAKTRAEIKNMNALPRKTSPRVIYWSLIACFILP
jgi:hypothetical protein